MKAVAVAQPRHDLRHEELREWTGDDFDPRPFRSMTSTGDSHPCSATGQKTRTPEPSSSSAQLGYAGLPKAHRDRQRRGAGKPETFTFLGFTHYCGRRHKTDTFTVWRLTAKKRMVAKLKAIKVELRRRMHARPSEVGAWLRKVVNGYYQYHAVPGNLRQLSTFRQRINRLWYQVLARRSQRARKRWELLTPLFERWIPRPKVLHPHPQARFYATHPS